MGRLAWSQLRFRAARTIALLAGVLLAATAFTVLTAASRTSQLRTVGTVAAHFSPAYDILVRPKGSRTAHGGAGLPAGPRDRERAPAGRRVPHRRAGQLPALRRRDPHAGPGA